VSSGIVVFSLGVGLSGVTGRAVPQFPELQEDVAQLPVEEQAVAHGEQVLQAGA